MALVSTELSYKFVISSLSLGRFVPFGRAINGVQVVCQWVPDVGGCQGKERRYQVVLGARYWGSVL